MPGLGLDMLRYAYAILKDSKPFMFWNGRYFVHSHKSAVIFDNPDELGEKPQRGCALLVFSGSLEKALEMG